VRLDEEAIRAIRVAAPFSPFPEQRDSREFLGSRDVEKKEDTVDLNTTEFKYFSYFLKLKRQIEGVWNYPETSRLKGEQGELFLVFTIKRNGELEDVNLIDPSGYVRLDEEAIRAIRVAAPFSPFPESWSLEKLNVRAVFRYQISYGWSVK
ncbi:MAG TPA: TonB family protein, partial [Thermodesulfobacteriota bacterium]|nr:TonB family protein [Thermodesulfobacteriota bacterium]